MTGAYLQEINCMQIESLREESVISLVVYAKEEEVAHGGQIDYVHRLSTFDRFNFPEQPILFFYNTDAECKKQHSIESDDPAFVMYV